MVGAEDIAGAVDEVEMRGGHGPVLAEPLTGGERLPSAPFKQ
jgi:hypothetical protein